MPYFFAMAGDQSLIDQIRLVREFWPLVAYGRDLLAEPDPYKRAIIIADAAEWMASRTGSRLDDEAVRLLVEIAKTPQGEEFIRWMLKKVEALS